MVEGYNIDCKGKVTLVGRNLGIFEGVIKRCLGRRPPTPPHTFASSIKEGFPEKVILDLTLHFARKRRCQ